MLKYIADWIGYNPAADLLEGVGGITIAKFAEAIGKWVAKKGAAQAAKVATGVGAALAVDGFVDLGIQIRKAYEIYDAHKQAVQQYCRCG